jgi:hypothetical protein
MAVYFYMLDWIGGNMSCNLIITVHDHGFVVVETHIMKQLLDYHSIDGIGSGLHVLRSRTRFRRYRRHSVSVFRFCAPGLIFGGTEGVRSRSNIFLSRTHFRRYRGCRVPFYSFALPDPFSIVPRASSLVFMFYAPGPVFGGTDGVGSCYNVLRS